MSRPNDYQRLLRMLQRASYAVAGHVGKDDDGNAYGWVDVNEVRFLFDGDGACIGIERNRDAPHGTISYSHHTAECASHTPCDCGQVPVAHCEVCAERMRVGHPF